MSAFDGDVDVQIRAEFGAGPLDAGLTYPDDLSPFVRGATWTRGRSRYGDTFPAGIGTLTLDNSGGHFYSFDTGSPYSPDVKVGVPILMQATHDTVTYDQGRWFVANWQSAFPTNREELVHVPIVETYARLVRKTVSPTLPLQRSDVRVGAILDLVSWPAAARNFDTGVAEIAPLDEEESTVGFRLNETAIAEQGVIFQAANGDIRFRNRVSHSGVSPAATFGPNGAELTYTDVTYEDNEDLLYNEAHVSAETGDQAIVTDATSAAEHGTISYPLIDSIEIKDQSSALNVAEWIVGRHKTLTRRINGLTIDPAGDPDNLWPEVLGRELRDSITVKIVFPGASVTFDQAVAVERISHSFVAGDVWTVSYGVHPLSTIETQEYWILGTSELGVSTRLA